MEKGHCKIERWPLIHVAILATLKGSFCNSSEPSQKTRARIKIERGVARTTGNQG
jgi:hypothetical protein